MAGPASGPQWRQPVGEHRYLTHTLAGGLAAGAATAVAGWALGLVAVLAVVALAVALAVAALGANVARLVALAAVAWVAATPHPLAVLDAAGLAVGAAVALGCWVHALGDLASGSGVPLWWPLPIRGRRWRPVRVPHRCRFQVGGRFERRVLWPVLAVACVLAVPGAAPALVDVVTVAWALVTAA